MREGGVEWAIVVGSSFLEVAFFYLVRKLGEIFSSSIIFFTIRGLYHDRT